MDSMDSSAPVRPPPRSSSIKASLCKLLSTKSTRSSYVLNSNKKLTRSRWSCSSLSAVTHSSPLDQSTNCSLTKLTEEDEPTRILRNLSLSKSSDLLAASISSQDRVQNPVFEKATKGWTSGLPGAADICPRDSSTKSHVTAVPAQNQSVVRRDKTTLSGRQMRPKSECILTNTSVQLRARKVNRSNVRHSTVEVNVVPHCLMFLQLCILYQNREMACNSVRRKRTFDWIRWAKDRMPPFTKDTAI